MLCGNNGKRGRSEDGCMDISIETDELIHDSLKKIRLDSPVAGVGIVPQSAVVWGNESDENTRNGQHSTNNKTAADGAYLPMHPLRRPRNQLDDSIDDIIRKSRRKCETISKPEYIDLQIVPRGPDPLQDRRVLPMLDGRFKDTARRPDSALWSSQGYHPNVYNYVPEIGGQKPSLSAQEQGRARSDSNDSGMETSVEHDSAHYANEYSHSNWVLSMEPGVNGSSTYDMTGTGGSSTHLYEQHDSSCMMIE